MSVFPGDVVSTSVGVLHVQTVVMERSREDVSFAMSGVDGRGVVHSNIPIGEGMVPLAVDVSDGEALVWFDRERRLRRLGDAVLSPGDGVRALGKLMEGQAVELSLSDCEPVDTVLGYLQEAEGELVEASAWVAEKRMECLGSGRVRIHSSGVFDSAKVLGGRGVETVVSGFSTLSGACEISAGVRVYGLSSLIGRVKVAGDIEIDGGAVLEGDLSITCTDGVSKVHNEAVSYWNKEQHHIPLTLNLPDGCTSLVDYLEEVEGDKFPLRGVARHSGAFPGLGLPPNDNVELNTLINEAEQEYRYASNLRQFEGE